MRSPRGEDNGDYEALRGDPVASIANLVRWERIKLREAAQSAVKMLETGSLPTREYLDYMWTTDVGMKELRARMAKLRERIAELELMKAESELDIP